MRLGGGGAPSSRAPHLHVADALERVVAPPLGLLHQHRLDGLVKVLCRTTRTSRRTRTRSIEMPGSLEPDSSLGRHPALSLALGLMHSVAPNSVATANLAGLVSTPMMRAAPACSKGAGVPHFSQPQRLLRRCNGNPWSSALTHLLCRLNDGEAHGAQAKHSHRGARLDLHTSPTQVRRAKDTTISVVASVRRHVHPSLAPAAPFQEAHLCRVEDGAPAGGHAAAQQRHLRHQRARREGRHPRHARAPAQAWAGA